jgi:quercetin dioxygenase-like cupin family protein
MAERLIEDPVLRQRFSFRSLTEEEGGELLRVEVWIDPGGGVTPHVHPAMEERFEVIDGRPSFLAGREWSTAAPGESVVVPPGTRHAYRNTRDSVAHVVCHARPPSTLQPFLEDTAALGRAGKLRTRFAIPTGPSAVLAGALLAHHYRDMVVLGFPPLPPPALQRVLFPPLARLAERRGYRPGRFAETV